MIWRGARRLDIRQGQGQPVVTLVGRRRRHGGVCVRMGRRLAWGLEKVVVRRGVHGHRGRRRVARVAAAGSGRRTAGPEHVGVAGPRVGVGREVEVGGGGVDGGARGGLAAPVGAPGGAPEGLAGAAVDAHHVLRGGECMGHEELKTT